MADEEDDAARTRQVKETVEDAIESEFVEDHFVEKESADTARDGEKDAPAPVTFDDIAVKLLGENFLLTALELHTELTESGQELPRLRDYFSNPGNFEKQAQVKLPEFSFGLPRTSSVQTFDSLDFTRYSDDGEKQVDERVAVLEFELRKAKETIKSLRANLTVAAESETNTPDANADQLFLDDAIKPHEQRALNFLVNEYLLKYKYKLTSITFSDENEEQDFEDWDDVGLNIAKPPDVLYLYRDFMRHVHPHLNSHTTAIQVNMDNDTIEQMRHHQNKLENEMKVLKESLDSTNKEKKYLEQHIKQLKDMRTNTSNLPVTISTEEVSVLQEYNSVKNPTIAGRETSSSCLSIQDPSNYSDITIASLPDSKEDLENSALTDAETTPDSIEILAKDNSTPRNSLDDISKLDVMRPVRKVASEEFHKTLLDMCYLRKSTQDNRLAMEVEEIVDTDNKAVQMFGRCLPYIVPNVILAKREELIPVLLCTINLHPKAEERDNLLNILFNLIKKPDDDQRQMILRGFASIAQQMGPTRIEAELLPQCWEQIAHKYTERRMLVAESCGVLAPYVPAEIRSSLLLSMLQQMLQDKSELVREAAVKSLAVLFAFIDNEDKFSQGVEVLMTTLCDSSEIVVSSSLKNLVPSFASWSLDLDALEMEFVSNLLKALEDHVKGINDDTTSLNSPCNEEHMIVVLGNTLCSLLPWLFISVLRAGPYTQNNSENNKENAMTETARRCSTINSPLEDINVIIGDRLLLNQLISLYDAYIKEEWYEPWDKFDWMNQTLLPRLINVAKQLPVVYSQALNVFAKFFHNMCFMFGSAFVISKLKPLFSSTLSPNSDETNNSSLTSGFVPIYGIGILSIFFSDEDRKDFVSFMQDLLITLCLHHLPLDTIRIIIVELCPDAGVYELLLTVLWNAVVHSSSKVRCGAARLFELLINNANDVLLTTRITPALVTLASDSDIAVRIATIPAFGAIIQTSTQKELLDKVRLQFQTFLEDPQYEEDNNIITEVVRTFGQITPHADSTFREEFVLPRIAQIAINTADEPNDMKKLNIAMALLEAYSSLSCCFLSERVITDMALPGLRSLLIVMQEIVPEHAEDVSAMIREFEAKIEISKPTERSGSFVSNLYMTPTSMEDVKNKMSKIFIGAKGQGKSNISNLFQLGKK